MCGRGASFLSTEVLSVLPGWLNTMLAGALLAGAVEQPDRQGGSGSTRNQLAVLEVLRRSTRLQSLPPT
jgi:hypothetical protein